MPTQPKLSGILRPLDGELNRVDSGQSKDIRLTPIYQTQMNFMPEVRSIKIRSDNILIDYPT